MSIRAAPFVLSTALFLSPLSAKAAELGEPDIRSAIIGKRMAGEYPDGKAWFEAMGADGTTFYTEGDTRQHGRVSVDGPTICFAYETAPQTGGCFTVWRRGANCFDFYGTNNAASYRDRRDGKRWDARGWREGEPRDCTADLIG